MSLRRLGTAAVAALAGLAFGGSAGAAENPPVPQIQPEDVAAGFCLGKSGNVPMRRVLFLENRTVDWMTPKGVVRVWLDRDVLHTSGPEVPSKGETFIGISDLIEGDVDVALKLAIHEGELLVYWRETFQHREVRQGLFRFLHDGDPKPVCEGKAGMSLSH